MKSKLDDEINALFRLPLAEFTSARNALASRLKKEGRPNEAERVKLLSKPSISAWAVNQLYWDHRDSFEQLIAAGKRFGLSRSGKATNMRDSLDARREVLSDLSERAEQLLRDAGHNPTLDTMRRITTTLEAISAHALLSDGPTPGRLTQDVDPPSFESLASLMSGGTGAIAQPARSKSVPARSQKPKAADLRQMHRAKIAEAKSSLQDAKRVLVDARARAQSFESAQKKASADAKEAEKDRREAAERLEKATAASEAATRRAQSVNEEMEEAAKAREQAKRAVDEATKELESLLRESPV
jgi:hypothetical protein